MRFYLVMVVVLGMLGSMLGHLPSRRNPSPQELYANATGGDQEESTSNTSAAPEPLDGAVHLQRDENGHFYADVEINGAQVHMLVDTGATGIALSREDARKAGIATSIGMNDVVGQARSCSVVGRIMSRMGRYEQALTYHERSRELHGVLERREHDNAHGPGRR